MIISVTHNDISEGRKALGRWDDKYKYYHNIHPFPYRETNCPIALAANRSGFINSHVSLYLQSDNYESIFLPPEAIKFLTDLNEGKAVYPFDIILEARAKVTAN